MPGNYKRKDQYFKQAKEEGYRSRAAYKLIELNKKYKFVKRGSKTIDLGAWPGGWLQVAARQVGPTGLVVGIDLQEIEDFADKNIKLIQGDVKDESNIEQALTFAEGAFDVVLSDMSPKLSGIKEVDRLSAVALAELAMQTAQQLLKMEGSIVIKVFKGNETEEFVKSARGVFRKLIRAELKSSRKTSNEFYLVGLGYKGRG